MRHIRFESMKSLCMLRPGGGGVKATMSRRDPRFGSMNSLGMLKRERGGRDNEKRPQSMQPAPRMKQETNTFLHFVDQELNFKNISIETWKEYLRRLPHIYNSDISFRLLFDWHWELHANTGKAWFRTPKICTEDSIFTKQVELINTAGEYLHKLNYQYRELILLHARADLRNKSLLEIGGSLPNDLLFDYLGINLYINIESPDFIDAESGEAYTPIHEEHEMRQTFFCNAEEIEKKVTSNSIDNIFSVACFEHIYDLPTALESCYECSKKGGSLYSYFAPIYSQISSLFLFAAKSSFFVGVSTP